jgi:uncharacterized LabA/DUF88 family protein
MANGKESKADHIALFIDIENFFGYCNALGLPIDLAPELEELTKLGKVTVRRSFGDIQKLPIAWEKKLEIRKMLQRNLVLHEDVVYASQFKNSADIRLVIEALSLVFSNEDIDLVAVVGSDRDYVVLLNKLRELGKETVCFAGSKDATPEIYLKASDYVFYHENLSSPPPLAEPAAPTVVAEPKAPFAEKPAEPSQSAAPDPGVGISLLVDALRALEAKGQEKILAATVVPMMRRLQADFSYSDYGCKSLKDLCQMAAKLGVIELGHSGSDATLKLIDHGAAAEPTGDPAAEVAETGDQVLKRWLEEKMKVAIPEPEERMALFLQLQETLKASPIIPLSDLASLVASKLKKKHPALDQQVAYKIFYSLYRANAFSCSPSENRYSPIINEFRSPVDRHEDLDIMLIENTMRLYRREHKAAVDPVAWSLVFYGTDQRAQSLKEIVQSL